MASKLHRSTRISYLMGLAATHGWDWNFLLKKVRAKSTQSLTNEQIDKMHAYMKKYSFRQAPGEPKKKAAPKKKTAAKKKPAKRKAAPKKKAPAKKKTTGKKKATTKKKTTARKYKPRKKATNPRSRRTRRSYRW